MKKGKAILFLGLIVWGYFGLGPWSKPVDDFYDIKKNKDIK